MLPPELQKEITPANILMRGPTGCGKTEIARRLASLAEAPFVKVEATKYTEVGIVGADTSSMIKDLLTEAITQQRAKAEAKLADKAREQAEQELLSKLNKEQTPENLSRLRNGEFDNDMVDMPEIKEQSAGFRMPFGGPNNDLDSSMMEMLELARGTLSSIGGPLPNRQNRRKPTRRVTVKEALKQLQATKVSQLVDESEIVAAAKEAAEQEGIIFIDEIDKLSHTSDGHRGSFERKGEGVQKEFLSLLEGSTVNTRHGPIRTDHILFICSGAFHKSNPSDLLPELQGRLPVRVELKSLTLEDLKRILSEKKFNILEQTTALLQAEGLSVEFTPE